MEFKLKPLRKYTVECPRCGPLREKKGTKSLQIFRDPDGFVRWQCLHAGQCEWNERQYVKDPSPDDVTDKEEIQYKEVIDDALISRTNFDNHVYWYRNTGGQVLFGVMRIDTDNGKLYVPVRAYLDRIVHGKGVKYPTGNFLFGAETLNGKDKVVVVEGEKAAIAAQKLFPQVSVVSWRGGAQAVTNGDWSLLRGKQVYLWPDNDEAGKLAMDKISGLIDGADVYLIDVSNFPPKSDLADPLPQEEIIRAVREAKLIKKNKANSWMTFEGLCSQDEFLNKRISFGYEELDKEVSWPASGVVVLEGRTKHGKSATAVNFALKFLQRSFNVIYFSYEIPASRVLARFARAMNYNLQHSEVFSSEEMSWLKERIGTQLRIYDQSAQLNLEDLGSLLDDPKLNNSIVVVDYAQIVPLAGGRDRHIALKELVDKLRVLSNKHGYITLLLSQLTPNYDNPLYDAPREAKDIHFGAEMVIRVWNKQNEFPHPVYESVPGNFILHILLNREGESGQQFGFSFYNGSYLEPNGKISRGVKYVPKKDRIADALEAFLEMRRTETMLGELQE